jgi:hypothetical protein
MAVVRERYDGKTKIDLEHMNAQFFQKIRELGLPQDDITLNAAEADFGRIRRKTKDVLSSKSYDINVHTAEMAARLLNAMEDIKIERFWIAEMKYTNEEGLEAILTKEAIRDAQGKSEYMLSVVHQNSRKLILLAENEIESSANRRVLFNAAPAEKEQEAAGVDFSKIKITKTVTARFEIK